MNESLLPVVSVVIPMLNEERFIEKCILSVTSQQYPAHLIEVVVVDGGSSDGSCEIVKRLQARDPRITLAGGPGINCPAAMNIGIRLASGKIVCKVDGHGYVAPDFIEKGVKHLLGAGEIGCVGGPIRPIGTNAVALANVLARSSVFGVGGGVNIFNDELKTVESVQCGVYRKQVFEEVGVFDEDLQFGEDEEMNWRVTNGGYKIISTPQIQFFYYPRDSLQGLFRQYFNYGKARVKVVRKHPEFLKPKHVLPALLLLLVALGGVASTFWSVGAKLFAAILVLYAVACLGVAITICIRERFVHLWLLPLSFACLHFGYGAGVLIELWSAARE